MITRDTLICFRLAATTFEAYLHKRDFHTSQTGTTYVRSHHANMNSLGTQMTATWLQVTTEK
jgi:hypothetical protein